MSDTKEIAVLEIPEPTIGKSVSAKSFAALAARYAASRPVVDAVIGIDADKLAEVFEVARQIAELLADKNVSRMARALGKSENYDDDMATALSVVSDLARMAEIGAGYTPSHGAFGGLNASLIAKSILGKGMSKSDTAKTFAANGPGVR